MLMVHRMPAFVDELEKIAATRNLAMPKLVSSSTRIGRRPIRAHKLLEKETSYWSERQQNEERTKQTDDQDDGARYRDVETNRGMLGTPESGA
jgi:hypothetical protein